MGEALRTLERAMFLYLLYPTTGTSLPALPDRKKSPRLQFIDIGLLNYSAGVQGHYIGLDDLNSLYRGKLVEQIVGQEVLERNAGKLEKPRFWVREKSGSSAEVDFVYPFGGIADKGHRRIGMHLGIFIFYSQHIVKTLLYLFYQLYPHVT
ncbi:MAG: DUF4143 domain-containing protein, partial [Spirochaetia bacterium]|nr:DUF4143 domain-containing protein [Spirochaetia bacterium]